MKRVEISVKPTKVDNWDFIVSQVKQNLNLKKTEQCAVVLNRKSLDARPRKPIYRMELHAYPGEEPPSKPDPLKKWKDVSAADEVHIIGAGPAGYFAALQCIESGLKPIVYDRGKKVRRRRRDLRDIQQEGIVNPDSNYCFGEGGAGTYSDGKLYTRSYKRKQISSSIEWLIVHGAQEDIRWDTHPHIGSNKLPGIVQHLRDTIEKYGGEVHFGHKLTDIVHNGEEINSIGLNGNMREDINNLILATGHSARDVFHLLNEKNIHVEPKPFALGVRIEHPQALIDEMQYGGNRHDLQLPASAYKVAVQVDEKGVFSFCMCPGGLIVPASTSPGEIVVNGMSLSKRNSAYANSGVVTEISLADVRQYEDSAPFQCVELQSSIEKAMYNASDGTQRAPANRLTDFLNGNFSSTLPDTSYIPGIISTNFSELLPDYVFNRLCRGISQFTQYLPDYITEEAVVVGTESRTSSPVRIPRDSTTYQHIALNNLYPAGEGAGYAGGILSAAMDGRRVVRAIKKTYYE